jgi:hypothetical protein
MRPRIVTAILLLCTTFAPPAQSHPGGLNAEGCHNNRKTGDYHCHRSSSSSTRTPPANTLMPARNQAARSSPYYANCAAARAAGAAPLSSGDPGYRSGLDRDGDGIACE